MKILTRLMTFVMSLLLTSLIVAWAAVTVLSSATTINGILARSKIYDLAAVQTRQSISQTSTIPAQYKTVFEEGVQSALTSARLEEIFQPLLVDIITWLNQPASTPAPRLVVNISPVKMALIDYMQKSNLTAAEKVVAVAQVNQQLPDQFDITQAQNSSLLSGETNTSQSVNPVEQQFMSFKTTYNGLKTFALYGTLALILLTAALIFLTRKQGRTMLRKPAWVFLNAGIFTLIIWAIVVFGAPKGNIDFSDAAKSSMLLAGILAREAMGIMVWYGLGSLVFGGVLYGLSFFIHKQGVVGAPAMPSSAPPNPPANPNLPTRSR